MPSPARTRKLGPFDYLQPPVYHGLTHVLRERIAADRVRRCVRFLMEDDSWAFLGGELRLCENGEQCVVYGGQSVTPRVELDERALEHDVDCSSFDAMTRGVQFHNDAMWAMSDFSRPLLFIRLLQAPNASVLSFMFNHSVVDGAAGFEFSRWFAALFRIADEAQWPAALADLKARRPIVQSCAELFRDSPLDDCLVVDDATAAKEFYHVQGPPPGAVGAFFAKLVPVRVTLALMRFALPRMVPPCTLLRLLVPTDYIERVKSAKASRWCSTNDIVTMLVCKALFTAAVAKNADLLDDVARCMTPLNLRAELGFPFAADGPQYVGNVLLPMVIELPMRDFVGRSIAELGGVMRTTLESGPRSKQRAMSCARWINSRQRKDGFKLTLFDFMAYDPTCLAVSSWSAFDWPSTVPSLDGSLFSGQTPWPIIPAFPGLAFIQDRRENQGVIVNIGVKTDDVDAILALQCMKGIERL